MSNSNTEHSKQLRAKTAAEWRRKQKEEGGKKQISMLADAEEAEEFKALCEQMGLSKPKALKALIDFYKNNQ